jgi:hypothetical protein
MTHRWTLVFSVILGSSFITGCEVHVKDAQKENPFYDIAKIHSEGLHHALDHFRQNPLPRDRWLEHFKQEVVNAVTDFGIANGVASGEIPDLLDFSFRSVAPLRHGSIPDYDYDFVQEVIDIYVDDPVAISGFVQRIESIFYLFDEVGDITYALLQLEREAESALSSNDLPVVLWAIALALDSITYWHFHYPEWLAVFSNYSAHKTMGGNEPCYTWTHARRAAVADVIGGVGSGVGGSVAYAFRLMSRSGIVAAMIVGSVGASVLQAGMEYYNNCLEVN